MHSRRKMSRGEEVSLGRVEVCGWFGRDLNGEYTEDEGSLQYLVRPPTSDVTFDLTLTHPKDQERQDGTTYEHIFTWIMEHSKDRAGKPVKPNADFVCKRSALKYILTAPFKQQDYIFHATKVKGTIYLKVIYLSDYEGPREKVTWDNAETKYGTKFEHFMLADGPAGVPDPTRPILRFEDTACMYRSSLGWHTMMYAGEVDGLPSRDALDNLSEAEFVELKILKSSVKKGSFQFKRKLLQWWPQCGLSGFTSVIAGRYQQDGKVRRLDEILVADMPGLAKGHWDDSVCFKFLHSLLDHLQRHVAEGRTSSFEWRHRGGATNFRAFDSARLNPEDAAILPHFYRRWIDQLSK